MSDEIHKTPKGFLFKERVHQGLNQVIGQGRKPGGATFTSRPVAWVPVKNGDTRAVAIQKLDEQLLGKQCTPTAEWAD
jgi:hypothetical protein